MERKSQKFNFYLFTCILILTSLPFKGHAFETKCVYNIYQFTKEALKNRKSIFKENNSNIIKIYKSKLFKKGYGIYEKAKFKNKLIVKYSEGGCAHQVITITLKNTSFKKTDSLISKLIKTNELLDYIDLNNTYVLDMIKTSIDKKINSTSKSEQNKNQHAIELPCTEEIKCSFESNTKNEIKLIYDFAL